MKYANNHISNFEYSNFSPLVNNSFASVNPVVASAINPMYSEVITVDVTNTAKIDR